MIELNSRNMGLRLRISLIAAILILKAFSTSAQVNDTLLDVGKKYPNIAKVSISSFSLYPSSLHVGYERVLNSSQSIYIFGGYNQFPLSLNLNLSGTNLSNAKNSTGYMFGGEFRFYLAKENKYHAPHGIYLAPYVSYYSFSTTNTLTHMDSSGSQSSNLNMSIELFNIGGELGYQFVIAKRFVIDAEMLGPSFSYYTFQAKLQSKLNGIDPNETLQAVIDALKAKFPLLDNFSSTKQVYSSGIASQKFPALGFRYAISIGFMF